MLHKNKNLLVDSPPPDESVKLIVHDEETGKDRKVGFNYESLMTEARRLEDMQDFKGALKILDITEQLVHGTNHEKSGKITYEMVNAPHETANNNSGETLALRDKQLKQAIGWLDVSDSHKQLNRLDSHEKAKKRFGQRVRLGARAFINAIKPAR